MLDRTSVSDPAAMPHARSQALFSRGRAVFPDGTTRGSVERNPYPLYVQYGEGAYIIDVDGNRLLDLNNNFTTLIHGHAFGPVTEIVTDLLRSGTCFSNPTEHELALANILVSRIPAIEHIRFVNSGTEAVMFAIKAARAFTGKSGVALMEGAYHGAYDWAEAGRGGSPENWLSGDDPIARPAYVGTPATVAEDVIVLKFNDIDGLERRISQAAKRLACILIDPMPSRAGLLEPDPSFVEALTATARKHGVLIVADEVLNLRQAYGGASSRHGLRPDIIAAGKIIGGGFPIGAIGGRADVMQVFSSDRGSPLLPQGGTFSANPISMAAGRVALETMTESAFDRLECMGNGLRNALSLSIERHNAPFSITGAASLFRIHAKRKPPTNFRQAYTTRDETALMQRLKEHFLERGVLLPHGAAACLSTAMTDTDVGLVASAFDEFLSANKFDLAGAVK